MYCCSLFLHTFTYNYNIHAYLTPTYTKGRLCYSVCLGVSLTRSELSLRHLRIFLRFTCVVHSYQFVAEGVGQGCLCLIEHPSTFLMKRQKYVFSIDIIHARVHNWTLPVRKNCTASVFFLVDLFDLLPHIHTRSSLAQPT